MKIKFTKKAFSLVELSIVIVIIGFLVAGIVSGRKIITQSGIASSKNITQGSPVFSIPDLELWLETTLDKAINNTNNSDLLNNTAVATWADISGNEINAMQGNVSNRPMYITNGINNLGTLRFDGINDCIIPPLTIGPQAFPNVTVFAVYQVVSNTGVNVLFGHDDGNWGRMLSVGVDVWSGVANGPIAPFVTTLAAVGTIGDSKILTYISRAGIVNGSSVSINGNAANLVYTSSNGPDTSNMIIGAASNDCASFPSNVNLSEMIVFNRDLNPTEVASITRYLSRKYNIALT